MQPSDMDKQFYTWARDHISAFRARHVEALAGLRVLEIGPEHDIWPGADTLGLNAGCTYEKDITQITGIKPSSYDAVICMEVLEHTVDPFAAVREIRWILKPGGLLLASAPWNFRCHGPIPDLWRMNQNTWRLLLKDFDALELDVLETPGRPMMPLHINVSARCNKEKHANPRTIVWEMIP